MRLFHRVGGQSGISDPKEVDKGGLVIETLVNEEKDRHVYVVEVPA